MRLLVEEGLVVSKSRAGRVVQAPDRARRTEVRGGQPQVILVGGYAGSGKTEFGRVLARMTGWPILDKDTITRPVVEVVLKTLGRSPHDRESDVYLTTVRPSEYEALTAAAAENVQCQNSVIVTAPFIREFGDLAWIGQTLTMFADMNASPTLVWMYCDAATMHTYIRHRAADRDAHKLANWADYLSTIRDDFRPPEPYRLIENCTASPPLQSQAEDLVKHVLQ
jgi:predicted kinase